MAAPAPEGPQRFIDRHGRTTAVMLGLTRRPLGDLYHLFLKASWGSVIGGAAVAYFAINALFAFAYMATGGVENVRQGSFADSFFFSIETFSTVGYGHFSPLSTGANLIVSVESFVALLATAMITGLMFAKFARPTARVLWSRVAVIAPQDGALSLMFRMANERGNQVVEARLRLMILRDEVTAEGQKIRRQRDLKLVRSESVVFVLSWTAVHPLDKESPLYGLTKEQMKEQKIEVVASLTGLDETFSQTIHSRHSWTADDVVFGARFLDIFGELPDGRRSIDYTRFHDTKPL
jgi:inward rectifier potassium channel